MKRWLMVICIMVFPIIAMAGRHTYAEHSVLRKGNFVKIRVSETGVHCLPYDSLVAWGLDPLRVRILGYGGNMLSENFTLPKYDDLPSIPYYMHQGKDGVFGKGDYLLFYAEGPVAWHFSAGRWRHTQNPYSRYGYYFLSDDAGEPILMPQARALDDENVMDVDWHVRYMVHEIDSINLIDKSGVSGGGREFFHEKLHGRSDGLNIRFNVPDVLSKGNVVCMTDFAVTSTEPSRVTIGIGSARETTSVSAITTSDFYLRAIRDSLLMTAKANESDQVTVKIHFSSPSSGAEGYLNYVEVNVACSLVMRGNQLPISNVHYMSSNCPLRFTLSNATASTQIWRVTDGVKIEQMPTTMMEGKLSWVGNNDKADKYVAVNVNGSNWKVPRKVGNVANQDLHALNNIDYVIICPSAFKEPAIRLAKKHEEKDFLTWAVVTDEEVYNEFSSGTPDVSAYRWLMKMLYDRANGDVQRQPKSLLLMGNASYDNRKILNTSGVSHLLVYEGYNSTNETKAYGTDDYCGFMMDDAGVQTNGKFDDVYGTMQIGVGRLPVRTLEQANQVVDKLCHYMDNPYLGKWKNQICFLADDGDGGTHVQTAEAGAQIIAKENPNFVVNKIYLDAYEQEVNASGESYPLAQEQFMNQINKGVLFMNYSGHGGYNNITNELILRTRDIKNLQNKHLALWFLATCSFSHFDGGIPSAAEELLLNPNGGAIGVISACRTVYAMQNTYINRHFCDTIFGHKGYTDYNMTIGEANRIAKNKTGSDRNKMAYVLLGDPALRLNYPTDYMIKTTTQLDTLHALTVQKIAGYVATAEGDTASWFNGIMEVTVWDKKQEIMTRDNDEPKEWNKKFIAFEDYPNVLFAGQASVVDGKFEFTFMVPKDIRYNYGNGRIVYYASDKQNQEEANGYYEDFVLGGSSMIEWKDTIGPDIRLYLNTPAFMDGDQTYEFPHFYAELYDENGINTTGSGIGHDLLMTLDNDPQQMYVLNDYFLANNNSYQRGLVSYKMPELTEGTHTLTFRAWDLLNNSSSKTLNFQVVKGLEPKIYQVITYPNPVPQNGVLHIRIAFDQEDELLESVVNIYDLSGRLISTYKQNDANEIIWNVSDMHVTPGIYMYQVKIKTTTSDYVSKAGKIIISE